LKADPDHVRRKFNIREIGSGSTPMLFAHGFGCDQTMWRDVAPCFADRHRVILFDTMGAGASDASFFDPRRYADLKGYSRDVLEICEALDLTGVVLVGHSVSAMIGLLAAVAAPERFAELIMIGPSPCYLDDGNYRGGFDRTTLEELLDVMDSNFLGWSATMAPMVMGNPDRPELGELLTESFCRADPDIARHFARVTFFSDNRADLPLLRTPALILQCADDVIAPDSVGQYLHTHLAGSTLVSLRATGHCPHISHPEEVVAVMRDYLTRPATRARDAA
jgi:sigma-B regulation protein RsbQ